MSKQTGEKLRHGPSDERVEQVVGNLLRIGVLASAAVVLAGGLLFLMHEGRSPAADFHDFRAEPAELRSPVGIFRETAQLHSTGLIMLGLLLLIATPVARVVFSVVAFALQRDYLYVFFTLFVLAVLLYSVLNGGIAGNVKAASFCV
jgi:uncharacterized membrane protein